MATIDKNSSDVKRLLKYFFPIAWIGHISLGLNYGIMGPARPYLASQVGVGNQGISLLWSARAVGVSLACLISGPGFGSKFMEPSHRRLLFLGATQILVSICIMAVPFMNNFLLLLSLYGLLTFASGSFDLTDNQLMNMMLGPQVSRPFVQSIHAFAAVGLVVVTPLVPFFLPESAESSESSKVICAQLKQPYENETINGDFNANTSSLTNQGILTENGWPVLAMPFLIVSLWILVGGIGLVFLAIKGFELPDYFSSNGSLNKNAETMDSEEVDGLTTEKWRGHLMLILTFLFYFLFCSFDLMFQSELYTFALCGPLEMTPTNAGWLNTIYYAAYTIGRLVSVPLSTIVSPAKIIMSSCVGCLLATVILILFGNYNSYALFASTGLLGFGVCFLFGSGISWITSNIPSSMKNRPMSFIYMGANTAICVGPIVASKMFDLKPIYVFYACLVYVILTITCFLSMILIARGGNKKSEEDLRIKQKS